MFSTKLGRVANRTNPASLLTTSASGPAQRTAQRATTRPTHQRRQSSSKASCPPDNSPKPAPAAKAATTPAAPAKQTTADAAVVPRPSKRHMKARRPRAAPVTTTAGDQFSHLPVVPTTHHLPPVDVSVSSFFSLHRPLSLNTTVPPPTTSEAFDALFEPSTKRDPWRDGNSAERRPEDVIYALQTTVDILERNSSGNTDEGVRWEVVHEGASGQDGVKHLDGAPRPKNFDDLVAQFKPYYAPPPPQAFPEEHRATEKKKAASKQRLSKTQPRQKSYSTTIIVTESLSEDGQTTYTAQSTPIVHIADNETAAVMQDPPITAARTRLSFAARMQQRQQASLAQQKAEVIDPEAPISFVRRPPFARARKMLLISVKRQRKLKMKKHKYKKLMKRTRNLRRRQDRA